MHRKVKSDVLSLPNKNIYKKYFKLDNSNDYLVSTVKKEVNIIFNELYNKELANSGDLMDRYIKLVNKYHNAPKKMYDDYINYISYLEDNEFTNNSEVFIENMENFVKTYVLPNIKQPLDVKEFKDAETAYLRMKQRALGKAMGQVLHPRRKEMFIQLYEQNKDEIIGMIHSATKKTVIFSTSLDVVKYISDDLSKNGVKNVKIIGETKDRMTLIQDFKNNDEIEVLVATSQTLSTGVTLTEANQMLFFGTPWRSADYDQCCDRIYRIGQNTDVDIYNILLETGDKLNLSTRMNDILEWSDEMFNSMIGDEK
jgi:SNF2 family DNA or RNA helicase